MVSPGMAAPKKKAMWLYPKVMGFSPPERWGHSSCHFDGFLYVFGGCYGGLHFSDVLVLNLETMAWNTLITMGQGPGPRDSHSAVLVSHKMIVFGGTNGAKKVNDLHILDLRTRQWVQPNFLGVPPSPRESHTATIVGDCKLVIFGGSGEGEANYLNDLHILDLTTMSWSSPEMKGDMPVARDSHSAVAIENKLFVYGGDCGDRYQGDVDVLDMKTLTWSRLAIHGPLPGVRAGHATVNFGTKVYVISGVGDQQYYNDVWVLDVATCSWTQLEIIGQQPKGRFSHTATIYNTDIAIYGGCGEDEHPLNELLILELGVEFPNGCCNASMCKIFGSHCNQQKRSFTGEAECDLKTVVMRDNMGVGRREAKELEPQSKLSSRFSPGNLQLKRRRTGIWKTLENESEPEEHSLSLSQHSSPSQSDQEQTSVKKAIGSVTVSQAFPLFKHHNPIPSNPLSNNVPNNPVKPRPVLEKTPQNFHLLGVRPTQPKPEQCIHVAHMSRQGTHCPTAEEMPANAARFQNQIGAEVHGKVDGAFDSGYLMTATVNGKIFRGVLFAPGPEVVLRGSMSHMTVNQPNTPMHCTNPILTRNPGQLTVQCASESNQTLWQAQGNQVSSLIRAPPCLGKDPKLRSELEGVVLTLRGPN